MVVASSERLVLEFVAKDSVTGPLKVLADNAIAQIARLEAAASRAKGAASPGASPTGAGTYSPKDVAALKEQILKDVQGSGSRAAEVILRNLEQMRDPARRAGVVVGEQFGAGAVAGVTKSEAAIKQAAARVEKTVASANQASQRGLVVSVRGRDAAAQLRSIEDASRSAAFGIGRVGAEAAAAFGPAGAAVRDVAGEVVGLGGGLDMLISKLGLSRGVLLGLGAGVGVLAALSAGVGALVSQAADAEKKLLGVAASSQDPAAAVASVERIADSVRERLGGALADDDILKLAALAFREAGQDSGEAYATALRASVVAALGGGDPVGAFKALDSVFQNFDVDLGAVPDQLDRLDSIAKSANVSVLALFGALDGSAPTAGSLRQRLDEVAAAAAGAKLSGANLEEVGRGLTGLFGVLGDKTNAARLRLEGLGVRFEDAAGNARPLLEVIDDLAVLVGQNKNLLFELFPADRVRREISKIIEGAGLARSALLDASTAGGGFEASARGALNLPSLSLGRTGEGLSTAGKDLGRGALNALGSAFGTPVKIPTEVQVPDNIRELQDAFLQAANKGLELSAQDALNKLQGQATQAGTLFAAAVDAARAQYATQVRSQSTFGDKNERAIDRAVQDQQIKAFKPGGLDEAEFRKRIFDVEAMNRALANTGKLIDRISGRAFKFVLTPDGDLDRKFLETVAALPVAEAPIDLVLRDNGLQAQIQKILDRTDFATLPIAVKALPPEVENARAFLDTIPDAAKGRENLSPAQQAAYDKATETLERFYTELDAIAQLDADIAARTQSGPDRIAADAAKRAEDIRKRLEESPAFKSVKGSPAADRILAGADDIQGDGKRAADAARTRETVDANARLLGLKIQLIDRERSLAAAVGVTADSDAEAARALSERAKLQRDLVLAQIAGQRAAIDPTNTDALAALKEQEDALLRIVDAETAAAAAAFDRARIDRSARTTDLVTDAGDDLRVGLDREFAAIERNRQAKIKAAEDGVRAGTLEADALARLLPIYDAVAQRDQERALRAASQRDAEDIANLVRDASGAYADQAGALQLIREVERDRYAEALAAEGLLQDEIEKRLALFDRITEKQKSAQAIQFARTPAVQIALDGLDDDAFARAQAQTDKIIEGLREAKAPAEEIGRAIEEGMQRAVDAIGDARTGMTALVEGWKAGWKDFLREVNDDAAFGARAAGQLGGGFRDGLSGAFRGERKEGQSVGETFLYGQLENVQKQASDFAANKVSAGLFGALGLGGENQVGTPEEQLSLAATTFSDAVNRFAAASDPAANFALGTDPTGLNIPIAQGYDPSGNAIDGFIGPQVPSDILDSPYQALPEGGSGEGLTAAGDYVADTLKSAGTATANSITTGGNVFGAGLSAVVNGIGNALSGILNSVVGGISGSFAEGGIVQGSLKPYTPHRAQYGRIARQRTLIEVAERPGLEEAIIPLRGGAVPVTLSRKEAPGGRDYDREATTELVQAVRGLERRSERSNRAEQGGGRQAPNVTVQGSTVSVSFTVQGGQTGDRGEDLLRAMPEIEKRLTTAIETMQNRRLVNAIRGAVA